MAQCGFEFNDTEWGFDWCTKRAGHNGDHYDSVSEHSYPNSSSESPKKNRDDDWGEDW